MSQTFDYGFFPPPPTGVLPEGFAGPNRRALDPIALLSRRFDAMCTAAVDPLEIAASLEANGITDRVARDEYGCADVFELADSLFRRVPLRPTTPTAATVLSATPQAGRRTGRELGRGVLFGLPGLFYPAVFASTDARTATIGLVLSLIASWAWSQGMARVAYLYLGRGNADLAKGSLRSSLFFGLVLTGGLAVGATLAFSASPLLVPVAVAQAVYQLSAVVVLFFDADRRLFSSLSPGLLAAALYMASGMPPVLTGLVILAEILSIGFALAVAMNLTVHAPVTEKPKLTHRDIRETAPFVVYGMLCAGFLSLSALTTMNDAVPAAVGLAVAPLVLSMGAAEWRLRRYRERVLGLLQRTYEIPDFARGALTEFLRSLGIYWAALLALTLAFACLATLTGALDSRATGALGAHLALGGGFFAGFVLTSHGRIILAIASLAGVFLCRLGLTVLPIGLPQQTLYLGSSVIFALALILAAYPVLIRVSTHR